MKQWFAVKEVPVLFWSAPKALTIRPPVVSVLVLAFGLFLFGLGEALIIAAGVGVSPWAKTVQGLTPTPSATV